MTKEKVKKAPRTIRNEQIDKPEEFVTFIMNDFFAKNGYKQKQIKGETVWQCGTGMLEVPRFMKYTYENGLFHLEAWIKTAFLPGVYGKEQSLDGFTAAVPKSSYKKEIDTLIDILYQPIPEEGYNNTLDENGNPVNGPIEVQCFDTSKKAISGFICALVGIVFAFMGGWLALIFGAIAIINGKKSMNSKKKGLGTAAFVIGIIDMVIFAVVFILSIVFAVALL